MPTSAETWSCIEPGGGFEVETDEVPGIPMKVFKSLVADRTRFEPDAGELANSRPSTTSS